MAATPSRLCPGRRADARRRTRPARSPTPYPGDGRNTVSTHHPDLLDEQRYLDHAHDLLARGHADSEATIADFVPNDNVAMTRCTHELHVMHTQPLPSGFAGTVDRFVEEEDRDHDAPVAKAFEQQLPLDDHPRASASDIDEGLLSRVTADLRRLSSHDLTLVAALVERLGASHERLDHP